MLEPSLILQILLVTTLYLKPILLKWKKVLFNSYKILLTMMIFYPGRSLCSLIDLCVLFLRHTIIKAFTNSLVTQQSIFK